MRPFGSGALRRWCESVGVCPKIVLPPLRARCESTVCCDGVVACHCVADAHTKAVTLYSDPQARRSRTSRHRLYLRNTRSMEHRRNNWDRFRTWRSQSKLRSQRRVKEGSSG